MDHRPITRLFMSTAGGLLVAAAGATGPAMMAASGAEVGQDALPTAQVQSSQSDGGGAGDNCGVPSAGDCCIASVGGSPGCNDARCCEAVCRGMPFCCEVTWDQACADQARVNTLDCPPCDHCGAARGGCCFPHGMPSCRDAPCCEAVCAIRPLCCSSAGGAGWTQTCVDIAATMEICECHLCGAAGAGSCFEVHPTHACDDEVCCEAVCAVNERCCIPGWDGWPDDCVAIAKLICGRCGASGTGDCFEVHSAPACNSVPCCEAVCGVDPACCDRKGEWDSRCVALAEELCVGCGGPGTGSCFEGNVIPACDNATCCEAVCARSPDCCSFRWRDSCAADADDICARCGGPAAGSCFEVSPTPACDDADCCEAACAFDSFCCNRQGEWDLTCVALADELCTNCGDPLAESCCEANPTRSCDDEACCEAVCAIDPSCCSVEWDQGCADLAAADAANCPQCLECGSPVAGDCCLANGTPFCHSFLCCNAICAIRPQCCLFGWDQICADLAAADEVNCQQCQGCGAPAAGDCCAANGTTFCNDATCCNAVCTKSPQCCVLNWTQACADLAAADAINCPQCKSDWCGAPAAGDCCSANGTAFCDDATCCNAVCANSPQCCALSWTQFCADQAAADAINCQQCQGGWCGAPAAGDCCSANGSAFCDDATCCNAVCANSPQCCAISWTQFCADQAAAICEQCESTCPADLDCDGDVDLADFAALLLEGGGDVDPAEFAAFLGAFTGPG